MSPESFLTHLLVDGSTSLMPGRVPMIIGFCASSQSRKNPMTHSQFVGTDILLESLYVTWAQGNESVGT